MPVLQIELNRDNGHWLSVFFLFISWRQYLGNLIESLYGGSSNEGHNIHVYCDGKLSQHDPLFHSSLFPLFPFPLLNLLRIASLDSHHWWDLENSPLIRWPWWMYVSWCVTSKLFWFWFWWIYFLPGLCKKDTAAWLARVFDEEDVNIYDRRLAVGALIAEEMRAAVFSKTGFRCSAGIAHNKVRKGASR